MCGELAEKALTKTYVIAVTCDVRNNLELEVKKFARVEGGHPKIVIGLSIPASPKSPEPASPPQGKFSY
jgi:hypothetical protein